MITAPFLGVLAGYGIDQLTGGGNLGETIGVIVGMLLVPVLFRSGKRMFQHLAEYYSL